MNAWHKISLLLIFNVTLYILPTSAVKRFKTLAGGAPPAPPGPKLEAASVAEGACKPFKAATISSTDFVRTKTWYTPMASKYFYYIMAEAIIGRPLGTGEMGSLCLNFVFMPPVRAGGKYTMIVGGYKMAKSLSCTSTGFTKEDCTATETGDDQHMVDHVGTIVATDSDKYFLMARCVKNKFKDWAVFTSEKTVSPAVMKTVLGQLTALGFNKDKKEIAKYDACGKR